MPNLYNQTTGELISSITDEQLQSLVDQLEEESLEDQDYAIDPMTLAYFEGQGIDPALVGMLRAALGNRPEITVRWTR
jgi:processive 1,2-diacylglycerol beta-glucosyltransferase